MKKCLNHAFWNTHALLLGRILMGGFFLLAGIDKLQHIDGVGALIASGGLPAAGTLAWLVALFEVLAGVALILGKYFKEASVLLAIFTILVSFLFHQIGDVMFMKNMAITAGLLFMAAHGSGNTWKL